MKIHENNNDARAMSELCWKQRSPTARYFEYYVSFATDALFAFLDLEETCFTLILQIGWGSDWRRLAIFADRFPGPAFASPSTTLASSTLAPLGSGGVVRSAMIRPTVELYRFVATFTMNFTALFLCGRNSCSRDFTA